MSWPHDEIARQGQEVVFKQALIDKLTHENALLKGMQHAAQSARYSAEQKSLLDETLDENLQALAEEIVSPIHGMDNQSKRIQSPDEIKELRNIFQRLQAEYDSAFNKRHAEQPIDQVVQCPT